ncbi:hypothetical protein [Micrococcus terreus]
MLSVMEDLLDSWPGTLLVVSHDRYLLERVTDQQYAVLNGRFQHLPGGVDQYLDLAHAADAGAGAGNSPLAAQEPSSAAASASSGSGSGLSGAERRAAQKELTATERRMEKLSSEVERLHERIAAHDQSDFEGLGVITQELNAVEAELAELEERWLELSELVG